MQEPIQNRMKSELQTLKDQVERCLYHYLRTRDCDIELCRTIRKDFFGLKSDYVSKSDMKILPTQESVKRMRAKFNSKGMYYPIEINTVRKRKLSEEVHHEFYSKKNNQNFTSNV